MMQKLVCALVAVSLGAARAAAQNPVQASFTSCPTAASQVATERQVQFPAQWIGDTTSSPKPGRADATSPNVVQFVVDTLGLPDTTTWRAIKHADSALVARAKARVAAWRYTPAMASGCRVKQLLTVALRW